MPLCLSNSVFTSFICTSLKNENKTDTGWWRAVCQFLRLGVEARQMIGQVHGLSLLICGLAQPAVEEMRVASRSAADL